MAIIARIDQYASVLANEFDETSASLNFKTVTSGGSLWVWGSNTAATLATNDTISRSTPSTTFVGGTDWKQISSCSDHVGAIKNDGTLWMWGNNNNGQLGINSFDSKSTPVQIFGGGNDWKQVSCGDDFTAAIKTDGRLFVWGFSFYIGTNIGGTALTPVTTFAGANGWEQVSCGRFYTGAVKTDGSLWMWGYQNNGNMGTNAPSATNYFTPVTTFVGGNDWKQVSCGGSLSATTAAIKTDGTLWTWGSFSYGALGINVFFSDRSIPVTTFLGGTNWQEVSVGVESVGAIKTDGSLWTWGRNNNGELGINNTNLYNLTPVTTFVGGNNWKTISLGNGVSTAIKTDGSLWVWGNQVNLGLNAVGAGNKLTPVTTFAGGNDWDKVSTSLEGNFSTAIRSGSSTSYFASEFIENVDTANKLEANVFEPYDVVYDEFGSALYGAGQGVYMRQYTNKSVVVYNEIDEITVFVDIEDIEDIDVTPSNTTWWTGGDPSSTVTIQGINTTISLRATYNRFGFVGTVRVFVNASEVINSNNAPSGTLDFNVNNGDAIYFDFTDSAGFNADIDVINLSDGNTALGTTFNIS
jgi:alpha-tubulin suppressor-like RCC1 family protein